MKSVVIENPIINSPFNEPARHFKFDEEGITNVIVEKRRESAYFIPIAKPRKKGKTPSLFQTEWTEDRLQENKFINQVREQVAKWRMGGYNGVTRTTKRLLDYWTAPEREKRLFFCQIEALETAIFLTEIAAKYGYSWIENDLRKYNEEANPGLPLRVAFKMATGSGKTVVMAMVIAWQALNKFENQQDKRFSDAFLIATPGITIRDRLRVLLPNDPENYYRQRDIIPPELLQQLQKAKFVITNFHSFLLRETINTGKLTKSILNKGGGGLFTETPEQMVRRVCREFGNKKGIIVINDEAHHCYRHKVDGETELVKGDDKDEIEKREKYARVWISGLEAVNKKIGVKVVYDLSATPFFLRGSGYPEATLFPWVVSDFSLIDAIESGIVKVPRVPVSDDSMVGELPTYRDIWTHIRGHLPKKGRGTKTVTGEPVLPPELEGAIQSLYGNYQKYYEQWSRDAEAKAKGATPPVFIAVCNNTNVSKLVYDYVSGYEKELPDGQTVLVPGKLPVFNNVDQGAWSAIPNSILIDSEQLESEEPISDEFKRMAFAQIAKFKDEYRQRFPERDAEKLSDKDILREVMNTVGKAGKLGEHIKCVVSVSMLTEGWDASTVTHILGIRAFGTQLLCEQVVGRGLRRRSYAVEKSGIEVNGKLIEIQSFPVEYAEVYGVPFSFIPCAGSSKQPQMGPTPTRVRALEERKECEIRFPNLCGYRYKLPSDKLTFKISKDSTHVLSTKELATKTENAPIVGQSSVHSLDELKKYRPNQIAFLLAKLVLEKYFRNDGVDVTERGDEHIFDNEVKAWLFPQLLDISKKWLSQCVVCQDNTFPQMLLLLSLAHDAADRIYISINPGTDGEARMILPILEPYNAEGSTKYVDFDTRRPVYATNKNKCHVSHVVCDTTMWEQKMAQTLEDMDNVVHYVKNSGLNFNIPYSFNGEQRNYVPDFIARIDDGHGGNDLLNVILEVTGEKRPDKEAKTATVRNLWVPAVNNGGQFGRWAFAEVRDPCNAKNEIKNQLKI